MAKHKPSKRPATCHPDRFDFGRGLCSTCYFRARRAAGKAKAAPVETLIALLTGPLETPRDLAHAVELAEAELALALPEAARAVRRCIREGDPDKGQVLKAAEAVLRGFAIPGGRGLRRLLETPLKPAEGPPPAQVVIGLHVSSGDVKIGRVVGTLAPSKVDP